MGHKVIAVSLPTRRSRADEAGEPPPNLDVGAIYRAHERTVLRWAKRLGGPGIDAEDVVQDVFLIAKRRLRSFDGDAKITTWLFRTTQNVVQTARRKQRLRRWFSSAPQAEWASMGSPGPGPGESLQRDRDIAEVYRVLDRLPERERRVMILFEIEGLSTEEIAALTGTKVGSVRVRLFRAREIRERTPASVSGHRIDGEHMTKPLLLEPKRWTDEPTGGATAERAIGAAFRRIREATEPSQVELQRLAVRRSIVPRGRMVHRVGRVVVAVALILATGGVVGAALMGWRYVAVTRRWSSSPATSEATASRWGGAARRHRATAIQMAPSASAVTAALPPPEPSEAAALADAFRQLQTGGNAAAALRLLDDYERQFPTGALRDEARIARAEALITLGRRMEALPLLEGIEVNGGRPSRQVRITRAELLVEAGRCARATRDFDAILSLTGRDGITGRALYGRASCRLRAGDTAGARADLRRYVADFPDGAAVATAREALESMP